MAAILDQSFSSPATRSAYGLRYNTDRYKLATSFVPSKTANIAQADFLLSKYGSPTGNIFAELWSSSGGEPSALLSTSDNIDVSTLPAYDNPTWKSFTFIGGAQMVSGTTYFIIITGDFAISTTNWVAVDTDTTLTTYGGVSRTYNGSSWLTPDAEFQFKEYYDDTTLLTGGATGFMTTNTLFWGA